MSKNLIYMTAVNHDTSTYKNSDYAQYAKLSWESWCKKHDIDFLVIEEHNPRYKFPVWNKDTIFEIVGDTYDKIGYVDSDTMVKWDAPNPFDLYDDDDLWYTSDERCYRRKNKSNHSRNVSLDYRSFRWHHEFLA